MGEIVNPELDFEKRYRLVREVIETIILTVLMFLVIRFAVQNYYVEGIIGVPGDVITINDTTVIVDGVTLQETYVDPRRQGNPYQYKQIYNLVVPANDYFVLGDNRAISSDSRNWGFVPRVNIIGRAAIVYWPFGEDNDGLVPNVSSVFDKVHQTGAAPNTQYRGGTIDADGVLLLFISGMLLIRSRRGKGSGRDRNYWRERRTHQQI